ncbi:hypothetical protein P4479_18340 [Brevibacillus agri]|uniref:hypothetical protein n=1 Tax=Brevibacillus agri TaxID=51101 RepID=UPI000426302C|nr:hypothetical protein [Brevibacillus agri]
MINKLFRSKDWPKRHKAALSSYSVFAPVFSCFLAIFPFCSVHMKKVPEQGQRVAFVANRASEKKQASRTDACFSLGKSKPVLFPFGKLARIVFCLLLPVNKQLLEEKGTSPAKENPS